jgi:hypothetical protein
MTRKLLIATALTLGFGAATAMAQTTTPAQPETGAASPGMQNTLPSGWEGAIGDAFFTDTAAGTLRSEGEIRANWEGLNDDQQAQVRSDCSTVASAGAQTDDDLTTGSVTPDEGGTTNMAALEQICDVVGAM